MKKFVVKFNEDKCKGCELCVSICPKKLLKLSDQVNRKGYSPACITDQASCIGCTSCALICPDCAITIYQED